MNVAYWPPSKGGTAKTPTILAQSDTLRNAIRAKSLALRDGFDLYDCVVGEMTARYGLGMDTILSLGEAAGTCSAALALLDSGMPVEYILAMGNAQ